MKEHRSLRRRVCSLSQRPHSTGNVLPQQHCEFGTGQICIKVTSIWDAAVWICGNPSVNLQDCEIAFNKEADLNGGCGVNTTGMSCKMYGQKKGLLTPVNGLLGESRPFFSIFNMWGGKEKEMTRVANIANVLPWFSCSRDKLLTTKYPVLVSYITPVNLAWTPPLNGLPWQSGGTGRGGENVKGREDAWKVIWRG